MKMSLWSGVAVAAAMVVGVAAAQQTPRPWQVLNLPATRAVEQTWREPPPEYGPEPYYGLNGPVTLATAQRDLDTMRSMGFRAVTVQYGAGAPWAYLSPEYMNFFRQFVAEVKKRDMRLWIVDDAGYPSGFAGGRFTAEHPELRMQALVAASRTPEDPGDVFDAAVGPDTVAITAIGVDGRTVAVPLAEGRAHWVAPADAGPWTVVTVEHAFRTSPTRSDTNPKRVKDASQSLEDYLNPEATAQYLAWTHDTYKRVVGEEFGKTILGFRGDEPDYSIGGLPWTPQFFAHFEQAKGYDVRPYLAVFLESFPSHGKPGIALTPEQMRARADFYDVFADMFRDGFFRPQGDWCARNGLEYQVHLNHEEQQLELAHSEGDFFRDMEYVEVPGIDTIWHQIWTDTVSDFPRLASSAAHVYGHPRAFTESFAAYRPAPDITMARYILNEQLVRGVNLVETMYFPASSTPGRGEPSAFMRDPAYPALMHYTGRMSFLMAQGHPMAEVALLLPAESLWMGDAQADDMFVSAERVLSEHQVDFDIVGEDAIGSELKTAKGAFLSRSGNTYRTVIVPHAKLLPVAVVERLRTFAQGGGHVIFIGAGPEFVGTRNDLQARKTEAADWSWARVVAVDLPVVPTPPAQPPASAPAPMEAPPELLTAIDLATGPRVLTTAQPGIALRFAERRLKDGTVFLLFNESAAALNEQVTLRVPGRTVERWDAETGDVSRTEAKRGSDGFRMEVKLPAYATEVLVVR